MFNKSNILKFISKHRMSLIGLTIWFIALALFFLLHLNNKNNIYIEICGLLAPFLVSAIYFVFAIKNPMYLALKYVKKKYGIVEGDNILYFFWTCMKIKESNNLHNDEKDSYIRVLNYIITNKCGREFETNFSKFFKENYSNWFLIDDLERSNYEYISQSDLDSIRNRINEEARQKLLIEQTHNIYIQIRNAIEDFESLKEIDKSKLLKILEVIANDEYYDAALEQYYIQESLFDACLVSDVGMTYEMLSYVSVEDWRNLNADYKNLLEHLRLQKEEEKRLERKEQKNAEQSEKEKRKAQMERQEKLKKARMTSRILSRFDSVVVTECTGDSFKELSLLMNGIGEDNQFHYFANDFGNNYALNRLGISFREIASKSFHSKKLYIVVDEMYHFTKIAGFDAELVKLILNSDPKCKIKIFAFSKLDYRALRLGDANTIFDHMTEKEFLSILRGSNSFKNRKNVMDKIDKMIDGYSFEEYAASLLTENGYTNVKITPGSGDQGIDILAEKDGALYGIQCKCYSGDVGNKAVQEAFSGAKYYNCHVPVVLTNRFFTDAAKDAASKMNVLLWDRNSLEKLIQNGKAVNK